MSMIDWLICYRDKTSLSVGVSNSISFISDKSYSKSEEFIFLIEGWFSFKSCISSSLTYEKCFFWSLFLSRVSCFAALKIFGFRSIWLDKFDLWLDYCWLNDLFSLFVDWFSDLNWAAPLRAVDADLLVIPSTSSSNSWLSSFSLLWYANWLTLESILPPSLNIFDDPPAPLASEDLDL